MPDEQPAAQSTETERLLSRLCDDPKRKLVNFHADWEPGAADLSAEQRAGIINRALDDAEAQMANTVAVPVSQMREIVTALKGLTRLGQATVEDWGAMPAGERALRHEVFRLADMPLLLASQWLPRKPKESVTDAE